MFVGFVQNPSRSLDMFLVIIRIGDFLQMAADGRLRFVRFRPDDGVKPSLPFADVSVAAEEIHRAGAEAEQLTPSRRCCRSFFERWQSVAIFRRADAAGGVREMRVEGLAAVTFGARWSAAANRPIRDSRSAN